MKTYTNLDIIHDTAEVSYSNALRVRDILDYVIATGEHTFILPKEDYLQLVKSVVMDEMITSGGRTKKRMPFFSIAGITFTVATKKQLKKHKKLMEKSKTT
jgi:hypothetical protein